MLFDKFLSHIFLPGHCFKWSKVAHESHWFTNKTTEVSPCKSSKTRLSVYDLHTFDCWYSGFTGNLLLNFDNFNGWYENCLKIEAVFWSNTWGHNIYKVQCYLLHTYYKRIANLKRHIHVFLSSINWFDFGVSWVIKGWWHRNWLCLFWFLLWYRSAMLSMPFKIRKRS